jgi:predicted secreted protein
MAGVNAFGTELRRGDGEEPEVFTALADVMTIGGPSISRETINVTSHGSEDAWSEFLGGLKDAGELSLDVNYDPPQHDTLMADFNDEAPRNYELVFPTLPTPTTRNLDLILTGFDTDAPHDDKLTASLTFKITGIPDITPS